MFSITFTDLISTLMSVSSLIVPGIIPTIGPLIFIEQQVIPTDTSNTGLFLWIIGGLAGTIGGMGLLLRTQVMPFIQKQIEINQQAHIEAEKQMLARYTEQRDYFILQIEKLQSVNQEQSTKLLTAFLQQTEVSLLLRDAVARLGDRLEDLEQKVDALLLRNAQITPHASPYIASQAATIMPDKN